MWLAYFGDRYLQGTYAAQSAFSMMNEADAKKQDDNLDAVVKEEVDGCTQWCGGIHPEDAIDQPVCKSVARNQGCCTIGATASSV